MRPPFNFVFFSQKCEQGKLITPILYLELPLLIVQRSVQNSSIIASRFLKACHYVLNYQEKDPWDAHDHKAITSETTSELKAAKPSLVAGNPLKCLMTGEPGIQAADN